MFRFSATIQRWNGTSVTAVFLFSLLLGCGKPAENPVSENCVRMADSRSASKTVCFQNVNGRAIVEGDIDIGSVESLTNPKTKSGRNVAARSFGARYRWDNGIVPYVVDASAQAYNSYITSAVAHYQSKTNIRFITRTTESDYVKFVGLTGDSACASSLLGRVGGEQPVRIYSVIANAASCPNPAGSLIHELGHSLGLYHEQSREDRDKYVRLDPFVLDHIDHFPNSQQAFFLEEDIGNYDLGSIMHYSPYQDTYRLGAYFDAAGLFHQGTGALQLGFTRVDGGSLAGVGQRNGLSAEDIAGLTTLYSSSFIEQPVVDYSSEPLSKNSITFNLEDHSSNEDGFSVELADSSNNFSSWKALPPNDNIGWTIEETISGLSSGTSYKIRVRAITNDGRRSAPSIVLDLRTEASTPPAAPSSLTATAATYNRVDLTWADNSNETQFLIERKTGAGSYTQIKTVGAGVTSYSDSTVSGGTQYSYRVSAYSDEGTSEYSPIATVTTPAQPVVPAAPTNLVAIATSHDRVRLTWAHNGSNVLGFRIERKQGSSGTFTEIKQLVGAGTSYDDLPLTPSTQYFYQVRAYNNVGNSTYTASVPVTTLALPTLPAAPSNLAATLVAADRVRLTWVNHGTNVSLIKLERKTGPSGVFAEIKQFGGGSTAYEDFPLTPGTQYSYQVRAYNSVGHSNYSAFVSVTTPAPPTVPTAPSNLVATAISHDQVRLTWAHNGSNTLGFRIERKQGSSGSFTQIKQLVGVSTTYDDFPLTPSTQYFYQVRAYNNVGNSSYTFTVPATTPALQTIPANPSSLSATVVSASRIDLQWKDNSGNEDGFYIEKASSELGPYVKLGQTLATVRTFTHNIPVGNTRYFYRVRAFNGAGHSGNSNVASALATVPAAPTIDYIFSLSSSSIAFTYNDRSINEVGFKFERSLSPTSGFVEFGQLVIGSMLGTGHMNSIYDNGLLPGTRFYYRVQAYNNVGFSYSPVVSAVTRVAVLNAPTSQLVQVGGPAHAHFFWLDTNTNETGSEIERQTGTGPFVKVGTVGANVRAFLDGGLVAGTKYTYRVKAFNATDSSPYSQPVSVTLSLPAAPTSLSATIPTTTKVKLTWTDNSTNEMVFVIERAIGPTGTFAALASVGSDSINFIDNGLTMGTAYRYRVRSYNGMGYSSYTNIVTITAR